jgi:ferritin-like metal-binding protein YciE
MQQQDILDLYDLMLEQLRDLYEGEHQQVTFLGEMYQAADSFILEEIIDEHTRETRLQIERLKRIFQMLGESPEGEDCEGISGIIYDAQHLIRRCGNEEVRDAAIITAIQHINHYEMAGYGTAISFARTLEKHDIGSVLLESLREEKKADMGLSDLAEEEINVDAKWTNLVRKVDQGSSYSSSQS